MNNSNLFRGRLVRLAAPQPEDREIMATWTNDSTYLRLVDTDAAHPRRPEDVFIVGFESNGAGFHLRTLEDDRLIGFVGLIGIEWNNGAAMFGIGIGDPDYRGKGYGSDGLFLILRYAFTELNLYRVGLEVIGYNTQAIHTYEKAGFRHEGLKRGAVLRDGERSDLVVMGILRDEWLEKQRT